MDVQTLKKILDEENIPNMIITGTPFGIPDEEDKTIFISLGARQWLLSFYSQNEAWIIVNLISMAKYNKDDAKEKMTYGGNIEKLIKGLAKKDLNTREIANLIIKHSFN